MKRTKLDDETCLAAQIVSQTENTSAYINSNYLNYKNLFRIKIMMEKITSFKIQQKPTITEIEMCIITILMH